MSGDGTLWGLGIGPGDPDLITVKALGLLQRAHVIAYSAPETGESLARRIVAPHLRGGQIEVPIRMPLDPARFPADEVYGEAVETLGAHLVAGRDVAVLCEGDPFFYGSFMYLFGRMPERFAIEVIPGVSSLTACAARLGFPLAARNDVLSVVPAPLPAGELKQRIEASDAVVIIKVGRHFEKVRSILGDLGLMASARFVQHATMREERVRILDDIDPSTVPYFSMILIHRRGKAWQ